MRSTLSSLSGTSTLAYWLVGFQADQPNQPSQTAGGCTHTSLTLCCCRVIGLLLRFYRWAVMERRLWREVGDCFLFFLVFGVILSGDGREILSLMSSRLVSIRLLYHVLSWGPYLVIQVTVISSVKGSSPLFQFYFFISFLFYLFIRSPYISIQVLATLHLAVGRHKDIR